MTKPPSCVQVQKPGPAGGLRVSVGHSNGGRLLKGENVFDIRVAQQSIHERQLGRARVSKDVLDTFAGEDLQQDVGASPCIDLPDFGETIFMQLSFQSDVLRRAGYGGGTWLILAMILRLSNSLFMQWCGPAMPRRCHHNRFSIRFVRRRPPSGTPPG